MDGEEGKEYGHIIQYPIFSPDSKRIVYTAKLDGTNYTVIDGKELHPACCSSDFLFSPDSKHLAYAISSSGKEEGLIFDGKEIARHPGIGSLSFSPDSQRFAYVVRVDSKKCSVVLDGGQSGSYDRIERPVFSPDSKHLAYIAYRDAKLLIVIDGKEVATYKSHSLPLVFDTSNRLHVIVRNEKDEIRLVEIRIKE